MGEKGQKILIGVVALLVGGVAGAGYGMMKTDEVTQQLAVVTQERDQAMQSADRARKAPDEAAKKYGRELGKLVTAAPDAADDPRLIDSARAILAARDGFRGSLDGVRAAMNSEIDALALELGNPTPSTERIKQQLDGLKQNWAAKEQGVEAATRKLLADLGLLPGAAVPAPAAAPAPAPAPAAPAPAPAK